MNNQYIHHFACWAAARSVQNPRNKNTQSLIIKNVIEDVGLKKYFLNPSLLDNYDVVHDVLVTKILKDLGWGKDKYGVAAKIIAIYFKVSLILPGNASLKIINGIYPPLDSINLHKINGFKNKAWTSINRNDFLVAIKQLKKQLKEDSFIEFESINPIILR